MTRGLTLQHVAISIDRHPIIEADFHIEPGQVVTMMGPSGVGKSTLLAYLTGTIASEFNATGDIILNGELLNDLPANKRRLGILFQDDLLFPHLSVAQNLAFGMAPGGSKVARRNAIEQALLRVDLGGFADRDPATLSGGQKARVSLMRMLLAKPRALLLDEAFSRLDHDRREQVRSLVFDIAQEKNLPVLMVTHDIADAKAANGPLIILPDQKNA